MIQDDKRKTKTAEESGVAENEKANYSNITPEKDDDKQKKEHPSIRETDDAEKKDDTGGDLAGNASGNAD